MISQTANKDLMSQARSALVGKWGTVAIATLVYMLVAIVVNIIPFIGFLISLAITGPLALGLTTYMLSVARGGSPDIPVVFSGFNNFVKALCVYIIMVIVIMVGLVLLIIPGIIASLALSMSWYILADNPQMGATDVLTASYNMTKGNLWKIFCMACRFIGWALLCCLTLGIGFLFLLPYIQVSFAKFYEEIKGSAAAPQAPVA